MRDVSPKSSEESKSDMRGVSSNASHTSDNSRSPWDAVCSEASHAGIPIDAKAEEASTVKAEEVSKSVDAADAASDGVSTVVAKPMSIAMSEGVSQGTEVEHAAVSAGNAMDLLRDKKLAPEGMTVAEFGDGIWSQQEENGMLPEATHPRPMSRSRPKSSNSSGSGDSIRSRTPPPRGDISGNR